MEGGRGGWHLCLCVPLTRECCRPSDVDLSENQLGAAGAQALCAGLSGNQSVQKLWLAGNGLEEQAARYLAELLLAHTGLKFLDLSYNQLNEQAGNKHPAAQGHRGASELIVRGPGEESRESLVLKGCLGRLSKEGRLRQNDACWEGISRSKISQAEERGHPDLFPRQTDASETGLVSQGSMARLWGEDARVEVLQGKRREILPQVL